MTYSLRFTKQAQDDWRTLSESGREVLGRRVESLLELVQRNPLENPPPLKMLTGDLKGLFARRIDRHHRFVYQIYEQEKVVKIVSMWTHYHDH